MAPRIRFRSIGLDSARFSASDVIGIYLEKCIMEYDDASQPVSSHMESGILNKADYNMLCAALHEKSADLVYYSDSLSRERSLYQLDNAFCYIEFSEKTSTIKCSGRRDEVMMIKDLSSKLFKARNTSGHVYMLASEHGSLELTSIGNAAMQLIRNNYSDIVLKDYDHVIQDLFRSDPCGRLIILNGPPGTGKSYALRGFMNEAPIDVRFIFIPPHMISQLSDPSMIKILADGEIVYDDEGSIEKKVRNILILEDADTCLAPRAADNMNDISALLNFGDGLLGALLDLRLIATTNAKRAEIDSAILRPGRMCRHINIEPLTSEHATIVAKSLGSDKEYCSKITLAEVYADARR